MARMIDRLRAGEWTSLGVDVAGDDARWEAVRSAVRANDRDEVRRITAELHERLLSRKDRLQVVVDAAIPVVADEVAAFVFAQEDPIALRDWDWARDFPVLGPPFPVGFIEWIRPHAVLAAAGEEFLQGVLHRAGILVVGGTAADAARCPLPGLVGPGRDDASWMCLSIFGEFDNGRIAEFGVTAGILVDRAGRVVGSPVIRSEKKKEKGKADVDDWHALSRSIAAVGLMAICFMHCKSGVRIVETEPPARLNRARVRRGRPPLVRHRTLVIEGLAELLRREGEVGKNGLKRALHLVRGHFAVYTAAKPLLGHFVGTVFRAAHTRGRDRARKVTKDYEVEAPRDGRRGRGIGGGG